MPVQPRLVFGRNRCNAIIAIRTNAFSAMPITSALHAAEPHVITSKMSACKRCTRAAGLKARVVYCQNLVHASPIRCEPQPMWHRGLSTNDSQHCDCTDRANPHEHEPMAKYTHVNLHIFPKYTQTNASTYRKWLNGLQEAPVS